MAGRVDPWQVLALLARGRRGTAAAQLRKAFPDGDAPGPDAPPEDHLAHHLHRALGAGDPPSPDDTPPPGEATEPSLDPVPEPAPRPRPPSHEVGDALRALDLVEEGSRALRAGRIDDLVRAATAAEKAAPASAPWIRFRVASLLQGCFRFTGAPELEASALAVCGRLADAVELPHLAVQARGLMASVHLLAGTYHRTLDLCTAALELARQADLADVREAAMAHQFRGYVLYEWNRLDEARADLLRAWELAGDQGRGVRSGVARILARMAAERGDRAAADRWLGELESVVREPMTLRNREWLTAVRVRHVLGTGDLRPLEAWLRSYGYGPAALEVRSDPELATRLHELGHTLEVLEVLERWDEIRETAPRVWRVSRDRRRWFAARAASAMAVALEATGRSREADDWLRRALTEGAPGSLVRVFLEGSALRLRLARRAAGREDVPGEAARVLAAARPREITAPPDRTLTPRQLEVLALVAGGASNKQVARELDLSLSTVKTHLRHAFQRLDASSRTQAVARARETGLLD